MPTGVGNGTSEVVSVGLLSKENLDSYVILLKSFKKHFGEETCSKIKVVMTDKDSTERGALATVFPTAKLHICRFHSLQIFQRFLASQSLTKAEKEQCSTFFLDFVYCLSEDHYQDLYLKFSECVPDCVLR